MENGLTIMPETNPGLQSVRTLLIAGNRNLTHIVPKFFVHLQHLRVLDLSHTMIRALPDNFGILRHLRFLNVEGTKIEELPESITHLHHLQYLNVSYCHMEKLPWGIGHLKCLTHLDFSTIGEIKLLPKGVSLLKSLQILKVGDYDLLGGNALRFEDLKGLTKLRELKAYMTVAYEGQIIAEGVFGGMHKMRRLSLANQNEYLLTDLPGDMMHKIARSAHREWSRFSKAERKSSPTQD
ncbi:hypothetical protein SUGI_0594860 [Cryptomeria japonica]|nr:hypothetical protein SUGI_0594860 [Cryptomeria japonica]